MADNGNGAGPSNAATAQALALPRSAHGIVPQLQNTVATVNLDTRFAVCSKARISSLVGPAHSNTRFPKRIPVQVLGGYPAVAHHFVHPSYICGNLRHGTLPHNLMLDLLSF